MRRHLISELCRQARAGKEVFLLVGDLGFSVVEKFRDEFPDRFLNFGVAEQAGVGIAAGLASRYLPIVYSIANFASFRCLEQIRNDVAHEGNSVLIVSLGAGFAYGTAGYSHHAIEDASAVAAIQGIRVVTPACTHELDELLTSYVSDPSPVYLRLGSMEECARCIPNFESQSHGSSPGEISARGVLVVSHGEIGLTVREAIENHNLKVMHVSMPEFNQLSDAFLGFVSSFVSVLTVEENRVEGGFGSRLRSKLANVQFRQFSQLGVQDNDKHLGGSRLFHLERNQLSVGAIASEIEAATRGSKI